MRNGGYDMNDCKEWEAWDLQSFYKNDLGFNAFLVYPSRRNYHMKYNKRILCMDGTVSFEVDYFNYPELVQLIVFNHPTKAYGEIINIQNDRHDEYRLDKALEELGVSYLIINPSIKKAYKRMMSKTQMRLYWSSFAFSTISKDRMLISPKGCLCL